MPNDPLEAFAGRLRGDPFRPGLPITLARAPGRLDVMGGIADYSGSLVLQMPIREATFAAAQPTEPGDGLLVVSRLQTAEGEEVREYRIDQGDFDRLLGSDYGRIREAFQADPGSHWAAYVVGVLAVLARELGAPTGRGLRLRIDSEVPEGKGVSSSAALEVAVMLAVSTAVGLEPSGERLALACQAAENRVVGAPCGIMDQMASALGRERMLLELLCQPADVRGCLPIPDDVGFWGIDSGVRHAVSGGDYTDVRAGAFMGYRIMAEWIGAGPPRIEGEGVAHYERLPWGGYLANIHPDRFESQFAPALPERMAGSAFLDRYGGTTDPITRIDPDRTYAIREPTAHPIREHARVREFARLLEGPIDDETLRRMGTLMAGSHGGYSACGLGSDGTDRLVELVREAGEDRGLFGAKITGGGSGGTVAILGRRDAGPAVREIARRYASESGRTAAVFDGSSPGAIASGTRTIVLPTDQE